MRVFYTAGPGNAFDTFRDWKAGRRDLVSSHVAYSRQMMEACQRHGAAALITCSHEQGQEQSGGNIAIVRREDLSRGKSGLAYHLSHAAKARRNVRDVLDFGADIAVISEDTSPAHYDALRRRGVLIVQALHNKLWSGLARPSVLQGLRLRGAGRAYASGGTIVLSASDAVSRQVDALAGPGKAPILEFLPLYYPEHYAGVPFPDPDAATLNILFIGRVEEDKGALDLVDIAHRLQAAGKACRFHVCGVGGALARLQQTVSDQALSDQFVFHGWCDRDGLRQVMARCHVSIVPTRASLVEAFNQAVVEAVLSGRPVVASSNCPAVHYVGQAVSIVQADDVAGYAAALGRLAEDRGGLRRQAAACAAGGRRFLDETLSFGAALDEVFLAWRERRPVRGRRIDPAAF